MERRQLNLLVTAELTETENQFRGVIIFSDEKIKNQVSYICNNAQSNQNYFDFNFIENGEEFEVKGSAQDNIFGKITPRQRMLSLLSMELIFFTIEQLLRPTFDDGNGAITKVNAQNSTMIDVNQLGYDLILKK